MDEFDSLADKCKASLEEYERGTPLKDVWEDKDTIRLMKSFVELYWMWSDLRQ